MLKIIKKSNIILYHSSNNIIKNGYMTWFTDNINYLNNCDIYKILQCNYITKLRCSNNNCSYLHNKYINIKKFVSKDLRLIELNETNINLLNFIFKEQSIIDYIVYNKIDGFYSKYSYTMNCSVYYLFVNNNLKKVSIIKNFKKYNKKTIFLEKLYFNLYHTYLIICKTFVIIYYIISLLLVMYKKNILRKKRFLKVKNNNIIPSNPLILCWNIHYFRDIYYKYTFNDVIKYITKLNPKILCLQEVYNIPIINYKNIKKYLTNIGYKYILNENLTGLLFASKELPIKGEIIKFNKLRGYLKIEFKDIIIINTHLEVSKEENRVQQINTLINNEKKLNKKIILCGDFNTITKNDYNREEWNNKLIYIRNYMFEPKVVNILLNNNFIDNGKLYNKNRINTSLYDRRVDYIFTKNYNSEYYYVDINNKLSDHYPIIFK